MSPNFLSNKVILEGHDDVAQVYSSGAIRENLNAKLKALATLDSSQHHHVTVDYILDDPHVDQCSRLPRV